jgi:hypothetical protein
MKLVQPIVYNTSAFERDSPATYYDEDGIRQTAAADVLRLGYDPSTLEPLGAIIEGEMTNWARYSNTFTNAVWEKVGFPSPTVTSAAGTGPDGTTSASLLEVAGSGTQAIRQNITEYMSIGYTSFSIHVKATVPDTSIRLTHPSGVTSVFRVNVGDFEAFEDTAFITELPDGWFRCEIYAPTSSGGYFTLQALSNDDILIADAQYEGKYAPGMVGLRASSYFPTVAGLAGVRAADIEADPPAVVSSNIAENDYPEYAPATAYDFGAEVIVTGTYHRAYRSRVAGAGTNTGNFPPDSPNEWQDMGATNRWRMFDMTVGSDNQSVRTGGIDVTVSLSGPIDSVFLFNVTASSVVLTLSVAGVVVSTHTKTMTSPPAGSGWYNYFFGKRTRVKEVAWLDVPPASPATLRVQAVGSGEVGLGKLVVGKSVRIGAAEFGSTSIGITNFSTRETNEFGDSFIQPRRFVNRDSVKAIVTPGRENFVRQFLAPLYTVPCVYVTETMYDPLITLGFYRDFEVLFSTPAWSYCNIQVQGL